MFFITILATAISGMPAPEICFLPGQFRWTILPKEDHGEHSVSVYWTHNLPIERRTLYDWAIATPAKSSSPMLGIRIMLCAVGALLRNQRYEKRIKLALTIYRDFMQKFFYQILRGG